MPHFTQHVLRRKRQPFSARVACARWIMLDDEKSFDADPPERDRTRLLEAWMAEIGHPARSLQAVGSTAASAGGTASQNNESMRREPNAVLESNRVRVDTWRQQVRDGEQSQALLRGLFQDFMLRALEDSASGGPFANVAENPPDDQVLDRFWDWLHDEPIEGTTRPELKWRASLK
jgi:hypothetical protein